MNFPVRGTMVSSSFYSENGSEPVGKVTVTQYSNNPSELTGIEAQRKHRLHELPVVSTTQTYESAPASKSIKSFTSFNNKEVV